MNLSNARATIGLSARAIPTSTGVSGSVQIGADTETTTFPEVDVAYSLRAIFAGAGDELVMGLIGGTTTGSTAFVAGTAQVETASAIGTISAAGDASVVITAAGMAGSPKTILVPVANGDTATVWAGKVRTALAADVAVAARFTVGGIITEVRLTRKPTHIFNVKDGTLNLFAANDATLNIVLSNSTSTGIISFVSSVNTTAGVVSDGVKIYDGDGKDFEGTAITGIDTIKAVLFKNDTVGTVSAITISGDEGGTDEFKCPSQSKILFQGTAGAILQDDTYSIVSGGTSDLTITVIGKTA